jgi:hypothetical protein
MYGMIEELARERIRQIERDTERHRRVRLAHTARRVRNGRR